MAESRHVVYILKCKDNTLYTGYTNDFMKRLRLHEAGKGAKYTRGRGPFQTMLVLHFATKTEAMQREYAIKQLDRSAKERLINSYKQKDGIVDEQTKEL